jgi:hypothetical protein
MKVYILVLLAIASIFTVFQQKSFACSCDWQIAKMSINQQVNKAKKNAGAVFLGEVLGIEDNKYSLIVRIKVKSRWKGVKDSEVTVSTGKDGGDCGYPFAVGESYLIYANKTRNTELSTNICQRTAPLSSAENDIAVLGKPKLK